MNIVYRYLDIICKNASSEIKIYSEDFDECMDEIKIRTTVRDDQLNRGWIGDLTYTTRIAYNCETGTEIKDVAQSTYNEVLLASITVYNTDEGVITWEYRFLKK
jgi:hypothetical protein